MTLLVRNVADVVDAQVAFHLNAGVDFVLATDCNSGDGTTEILESYERQGYLRLFRELGDVNAGELWTRMARQAAIEHDADWVINSNVDEFWWPRAESLPDVLAPIPLRYTIVQGLRRQFVALPGPDELFSERMTIRQSLQDTPSNQLDSRAGALRPLHRADPNVVVHADGSVTPSRSVPLRAWYPIEVFHFPVRDAERIAEEEIPDHSLVVDTRLRDALRALRDNGVSEGATGHVFALPGRATPLAFRTPDIVDDAAYAVECAAVGEINLPGLERYIAELEQRIGWLEQRFWPRVLRAVSRLLHVSAR
jgi:hypothetical protein